MQYFNLTTILSVAVINKKFNHIATLIASGEYKELIKIREFISDYAKKSGLDLKKIDELVLAVDEACSNLIHYSINFDNTRTIKIDLENTDDEFVVNIQDDGKPFNPESVKSPNMKQYFLEFRKGGLGLHILKNLTDEIIYIPSSNQQDRNVLKLLKKY